ncbi:MAG: heavy metal translocating P-type ATPase [Cyanobacteria bacterium SID2]|nr:heavy metal translocating P-type ATPase [Cyanobacteria bacterium SID2]MBP0004688.1 heavy metal translocating P-type ATPase [Cyanobacteria bacterium SBC]
MVQVLTKPERVSRQGDAYNYKKTSVLKHKRRPKRHNSVPYCVVHAIAGRIRFRVPKILQDAQYARHLQALIELDERFDRVRVDRAAACIVILYQPNGDEREIRDRLANLIQLANESVVPLRVQRKLSQPPPPKDSWSSLRFPVLATSLSLLGGSLGLPVPTLLTQGAIAVAALPVAKRALASIFGKGRLNVDFLDLSALAITTAQGHFVASSSMVALIELGESIRDRTARAYHNRTSDLLSLLDRLVWVEREGSKHQIPIEKLRRGDTVIVYPGEQIPADGTILRGRSTIDEQKLTGESMPVLRGQGETVYASTLVREGQIYIRAEYLGADTRAGRTLQLLQDAPIQDTRIENYAAKLADRAVLPTLILGGTLLCTTHNAARAASIFTLDFATGIRVSIPTTVMAALSAAARRGILIKSGRALQQIACVDAIVFDKTGTLTQGDVAIVGVRTTDDSIDPRYVLQMAAAAEQRITHPVAEAIMAYAKAQGVIILPRKQWNYCVGLGIQAQIDGTSVLVGSERFMVSEGVNLDTLYERHRDLRRAHYPTIYVASNGEMLGTIQYSDPVRPESPTVVDRLRNDIGAELHMLTGDNRQRARAVAAELGIPFDRTHAEAFPEHKAKVVQQLHAEGKTVAFVGDGLNDSAALAYADVSVSFRDGSDIARETADVVLMENDLHGLVEAISIARHAMGIVNQNTRFVAASNLTGLAVAATVGLNPIAATLINNGSSAIVGANGLRPVLNGCPLPERTTDRPVSIPSF